MEEQSSRDFLSNLPLSIIHCILERVPIIDAVKTSLLSRQWRYKWATLPHLVFNDYDMPSSENFSVNDFISQVLFLHQGPILKFKLNVRVVEHCRNLHQWLLFLSRNGIRMLIMYLRLEVRLQIPSSLYSCQNLTHLEIFLCYLPPPPPTFKGFLCLRSIFLDEVNVSSNTVESLLADSTVLEEITLHNSGNVPGVEIKIHAPNLKKLVLHCDIIDICLYAPLLGTLSVRCSSDLAPKKSSVCTYTELLGGLTGLEVLEGNFYFFKYLSIGIESCQSSLVFPNLRRIELPRDAFYDTKVVSVVARLTMGPPNLQKLEISYLESESEGDDVLFLDTEYAFSLTFDRLKVIETVNVDGDLHWMKLIKFLLANSPMLETMICRPDPMLTFDYEQLLKQAATLLSYPRASSNAKILFGNSWEPWK